MKNLESVLSEIKIYYVKTSLKHSSNREMLKAIQSIGICILFFENSLEKKYVTRDSRNLIYDMLKEVKNKDGKRILRDLLKIIK